MGAEGVVAAVRPIPFTSNSSYLGPRTAGAAPSFHQDPEMGFCPLAPGPNYSELGTVSSDDPKRPSKAAARILFLGDSVTCRGRIKRALERLKPNPRLEWWNAGVESFNTVQAVQWYERRAHAVRPDLVVLTLHPNDLLGTSVCFQDEDGRLVLYREGSEPRRVWRWLYGTSHLYRWLVSPARAQQLTLEEAKQRSLEALRRLKARLDGEGVDLFVFAMPWTQAPEDWPQRERDLFAATREVAAASGAVWCDGLVALRHAADEGIELTERPEDFWHPGDALAERFAQAMLEAGLLKPLLRLAANKSWPMPGPTSDGVPQPH